MSGVLRREHDHRAPRAQASKRRHDVGEPGEQALGVARAVAQHVVAGLGRVDGDGGGPGRDAARSVERLPGRLAASSSAKQSEYFPGQPCVDLSSTPGRQSRQLSRTRRSTRPIVAFARTPGPNRLVLALRPSRAVIGPLTITISAEPPVLVAGRGSMNRESPKPPGRAPTEENYSGRP